MRSIYLYNKTKGIIRVHILLPQNTASGPVSLRRVVMRVLDCGTYGAKYGILGGFRSGATELRGHHCRSRRKAFSHCMSNLILLSASPLAYIIDLPHFIFAVTTFVSSAMGHSSSNPQKLHVEKLEGVPQLRRVSDHWVVRRTKPLCDRTILNAW